MKNLMWYGICQLYKRKFVSLLTIVMLALSFIVLEYSGISYLSFHYSEIMADSVLKYDSEDIYNINISKYAFAGKDEIDKLNSFYKAFGSIEGMEGYGMYFETCDSVDKYIYISETLAPICGVYFDNKTSTATEEVGYGMVGQNLSNVCPVGSVVFDPNTMENFRVISTLPDDSWFISDDYIHSAGKIINLDDYIIMNFDYLIEHQPGFILNAINNFYIVLSPDSNVVAVCNEIEKLALEYDVDIYGINSMKVLFEHSAKNSAYDAGERYLMPVVMLMCSLIAMSIATLISMRTNRRDMGIMLANGMTRMDVAMIYIFENIFKIVVAYIISLVFWNVSTDSVILNRHELQQVILPIFTIVVVFVIVISSLTPLVYMRNKIPCKLIGDEI